MEIQVLYIFKAYLTTYWKTLILPALFLGGMAAWDIQIIQEHV